MPSTSSSSIVSSLVTLGAAARRVGVSKKTLMAWSTGGTFPPLIRLGPRKFYFRRADLDRWVSAALRLDDGADR